MNTLPDVLRVLHLLDKIECREALYWDVDLEAGTIEFKVLCNDFFWWGTGDAEEVTVERLPLLEQAFTDVGSRAASWAPLLFAARIRGTRPQGIAYPKDAAVRALFDAAGPKREVDIANPYAHPDDGGGYAYTE